MSKPEVARAKQICAACPVRRLCLADGLEEDWGVWGGYTKPERDRALGALLTKAMVLEAFDNGALDQVVAL